MNLQARINSFISLGKILSEDTNLGLMAAKENAYLQNPWFIPVFIEKAIEQISKQFLDSNALKAWTDLYPMISDQATHKKVGIVMAGNIPLVGFHDLLSTLIAGHHAVVKLSSKDSALMTFIIQTLIAIDPAWANQITIQEQLKACDAYIATGSNNTGQYFEAYFGKFPHIIRKNKTSIALLDGTETESELTDLANDMLLYYGMGCRNVTQIWVPENYDFIPLLNALKSFDFLMDNHRYKNNYDYQLALLMMNNQPYMSSGSVLLSKNPSPFAAIGQIHYQSYPNHQMPSLKLDDIQCVVGHQYLPFGSLQCPRLDQYADGVDTLSFLANL